MSQQDLKKLLTLEEALKKEENFMKFAIGIIQHKDKCRTAKLFKSMKVVEWCEYLGCYNTTHPCSNDTIHFKQPEMTTPFSLITPAPLVVGYNGTCYDDYFCPVASMSFCDHVILGWIGLLLCIVGLLTNALCIPTFNVKGIRSGTTLFLTGIAIVDIIYLLLVMLLVVARYIPATFASQLRFYGNVNGYLIPFGLPIMELCEIVMVWFVVALLVDRHFYLKYGYQSKAIFSRPLAARIMITITVIIMGYTIPKFLKYRLETVESPSNTNGSLVQYSGWIKVYLTRLGKDVRYVNLMTHWLKVPIEMFLPYLSVIMLSGIITVKMIDTHSIRQRKLNNATKAGMTPRELIELRENSTATITVCVAIFLVVCKMPKLLLHVVTTEAHLTNRLSINIFQLSVQFLDIAYAFCKPLFCVYIGYHFRDAVGAMFCCRDENEMEYCVPIEMEALYDGARGNGQLVLPTINVIDENIDPPKAEESKTLNS